MRHFFKLAGFLVFSCLCAFITFAQPKSTSSNWCLSDTPYQIPTSITDGKNCVFRNEHGSCMDIIHGVTLSTWCDCVKAEVTFFTAPSSNNLTRYATIRRESGEHKLGCGQLADGCQGGYSIVQSECSPSELGLSNNLDSTVQAPQPSAKPDGEISSIVPGMYGGAPTPGYSAYDRGSGDVTDIGASMDAQLKKTAEEKTMREEAEHQAYLKSLEKPKESGDDDGGPPQRQEPSPEELERLLYPKGR